MGIRLAITAYLASGFFYGKVSGRILESRLSWHSAPPVGEPSSPEHEQRRRRHPRLSRVIHSPAFPLIVFFAGFPLWWALGFGTLGCLIMAMPLAYHLVRRNVVLVPRGFGLWLLFLAVLLLGVLMLWSPVPGLVLSPGISRIFPWAYRVTWFLAVTVVLLFIGNSSEKTLPRKWLILLMAWMFAITVAGGYAGQFLWQHEFPSLLEMVLPRSLRSNIFLNSIIHPGLAQMQDILGYPDPRPKAPFDYANSWGANFGLFLPFFRVAWRYMKNVGQKSCFVVLLLASIPPVIFSLNRGLWAGLGVMALLLLVRLVLNGRWLAVMALGVAGLLSFAVLLATPLFSLIEQRLANPHSNEGRSNLAGTTLTTTLEYSPLIGFGSTRQRQGNFFSIAAGATADCHQCSPPQLGTQGSLWYLIFGTGLLGTILFCAFIVRRTLPVMGTKPSWASPLLYSVVFFACVLPVYDIVSSPLMILMIALGLIWRFDSARQSSPLRERSRAIP